ncbi:MAG: hypothetical protein P8L30_03960 [Longimicrobiales bacterium]|nr:hypothetical protein [Gemmatimonadales bacterium]MBT6376249.1 hypothetical protein [Gemmatimonadales bacterium]MDG2239331.1 hypothetical protein [Longimicrobiales bacterium]NCG33726.1 hypothetical protein [Pseudomonadota bacterium]
MGIGRTSTTGIALALLAIGLASCGGNPPPPLPGTTRGAPPDLRGRRVIVLPVQQNLGVAGDIDAEMAFGLQDKTREVTWILDAEVQEILRRSPGISAGTRGLPVGHFLLAEVQRVGEPLYGNFRRMSALVDAGMILLPVQAVVSAVEGEDPRVELAVALIDSRTGRVEWFAIVEGGAFPAGDPRGIASAVDALARRLLWYVGV